MKAQTELTMKEVLDIVAAVFEYNGQGITAMGVYDKATSKPVDPETLVVVAEGEAPSLKVRVAQEGSYSEQLRGMTSELLKNVRGG